VHLISPWIRVSVGPAWLVSPGVLAIVALWRWKRLRDPGGWKGTWPLILGTAALANWILLLRFLIKSETPYGAYYQTSALTGVLLLLSLLGGIASIAYAGRWQLPLANLFLLTLWVGIVYVPAHWLGRVDFGSVKVDDRLVPAAVYFGNPTDSEAETITLVHVPGVGDYFFDVSEETFRQASKNEFIQLHYGVWTFRSIRQGEFRPQLPDRNPNECRIALAGGHMLTIEF